MSTSSLVSLGSLRLQCQERADLENNPAISTEAWNGFITNSYKTLYDMLISSYGNDYYVANTYNFQTTGAQSYSLPDGSPSFVDSTGQVAAKFYKLLGADLQYSASPSGFVTLRRFEMIDRNKYAYPNTAINWSGYTNLRYRIQGDQFFVVPIPQTGQTVRLWYAPAPTSLQFRLPGYSVSGSAVIGSMTDTTGIVSGMNITSSFVPGIIPANSTVQSVSTTTVTMSANALSSQNATIVTAWSDATAIEGIAGWEEFVIIDAAIKAQGKQENDTSQLSMDKAAMIERIHAMAEARDIGQAFHVSDALGANGAQYDDDVGGWGMGGGGY